MDPLVVADWDKSEDTGCGVGCVGVRNGKIVVEGWGNSLASHGLRVHAEQLGDSNDVTVRRGWDVGDKVPRFSVENQLVERGQALAEKDGVVCQILDPETAAWSPRGNFLSRETKEGSLKFEMNPASVAKTPSPCAISLSGPRVTETTPNHSHLGVEKNKRPHKNILEAEAIPESGHHNNVRTTGKRVWDPVGRTEFANQPSNALLLSAKVVEKLMDRQMLMGMTKGRGDTPRGR